MSDMRCIRLGWYVARPRRERARLLPAMTAGRVATTPPLPPTRVPTQTVPLRATLTSGDEALADRVLARRIRRRVLEICDDLLKVGVFPADEKFWIGASKVEAMFGLGRREEVERVKADVIAEERERLRADGASDQEGEWRENSLNDQLRKLEKLLAR